MSLAEAGMSAGPALKSADCLFSSGVVTQLQYFRLLWPVGDK